MWNEDQNDNSDLDAHCIEPNGHEIYFGSDRKPCKSKLGGQLDIDITQPMDQMPGKPAVENITWQNKLKMMPGVYKFLYISLLVEEVKDLKQKLNSMERSIRLNTITQCVET